MPDSRTIALAWLALAVTVSPLARAADDEEGRPAVVMVAPADQAAEYESVVTAVGGQLGDLEVDFRVEPRPGLPQTVQGQIELAEQVGSDAAVVAVFWTDLSREDRLFLFLSGRSGDRVLMRKLEVEPGVGRAETLAVIVRASVEALLQGGEIGIAVEDVAELEGGPGPPPPAADAAPADEGDAPPEPRPERLRLQLGYAYAGYSRDNPAIHGLAVGLDLRLIAVLSVSASYLVLQPIEGHAPPASARLRRHPLAFGLRAIWDVGPLGLGASLSLYLDFATQEVFSLATGIHAEADREDLLVGLRPAVELLVPVVDRLSFFVGLGFEAPFNRRRYVVSSGGATSVVIDGWAVQPCAQVGIWARLF